MEVERVRCILQTCNKPVKANEPSYVTCQPHEKDEIQSDLVDILHAIYSEDRGDLHPIVEIHIRYEMSHYIWKSFKICEPWTVLTALYYLSKYHKINPLTLDNIETHFWLSIMLAQKMNEDQFWTNVDYDEMIQFGTVNRKELNRLEREYLDALEWNLNVSIKELEEFIMDYEPRD